MRINVILRYAGIVMMLNAVFMLIAAGVSLAGGLGPDSSFYALLLSAVLTGGMGAFPLLFVERTDRLTMKEGYAVVVSAWLLACFVGMFPYLLWGGEFDLSTAWFESVSGFTTTGATALHNVEGLPRGLLFWRSSTHWLGGVGVVMFTLLIMPSMGHNKMTLSSVELSPLARDNYRYRTQKIVQILLLIYVGMTACETVLLKVAGMNWFDALNHSFSTISTGGFSTRNASIGYYDNVWIEVITTAFMIISGLHYGLIFATITGKRNNIFRSEVARFYLIVFGVAALLISVNLWGEGVYATVGESVRKGFFQAAAMITTTGFATADTTTWTPFAIVVLIVLMFQCGCAGSTSGGIKSDRILLAFKVFKARLLQQQHPNAVIRIKLGGVAQDREVVNFAMFFIVVYLMLVLIGTVVVAASGVDLTTAFSMIASSIGNIGPGFGTVGTAADYSHISPFINFFCTLFMLLGRLEIFGLIQLFMIKWWR
ncbi:TrkH family potassium uptake protein [Alistipes sp. OttesenSCG-928-B03]|nr:TrkH family potassium uptake protein [Alistipes sp. OttesenSCG-928-B03]